MPKRGTLIVLAVLLALLVPSLARIAWPFLTSAILAGILAITIHPLNQQLSSRIRRPGLATFLTTFATVLLLGLLLALAVMAMTRELTTAYAALSRRSLEEGGWPALVTSAVNRLVDLLATRVPFNPEAIRAEILDGMKFGTEYLLNNAGKAVGGVTSILATSLLTTIFLYVFLRYGEGWLSRLTIVIPIEPEVTTSLVRTVHQSVVANVNGVLAVAIGQGVFLGVGFWIVGVRAPALWGAIGGLASVVPILGTPLVWVPVVIGYLVKGAYGKALFLTIWGALVVGSIDNFVRPWVVGAGVKQHPVLVALAAIGGTYAFGVLGVLLGPLVIALASALLKEILQLLPSIREPA